MELILLYGDLALWIHIHMWTPGIYKKNCFYKSEIVIVRGDIHTQVAMLNVNMTFGGDGGVGVVDLDTRIGAKWYFSDFNVKQLYHM